MKYITIDSNIWIYANIAEAPENNLAIEKIKEAEKSWIVVNDIIISEVFHKLSILLKSKKDARLRVEKIFDSSYVMFLPIEKSTLKDSFRIAESCDMRINDAIIAAQCLENYTNILTDNRKDFSKIDGLEIIPLRQ